MTKSFKQFIRDTGGATSIEYGLIAALMAIAAITAMTTLGTNLGGMWDKIAQNVNK